LLAAASTFIRIMAETARLAVLGDVVETRGMSDSTALRLVCSEIWSGNQKVHRPIELPGVHGVAGMPRGLRLCRRRRCRPEGCRRVQGGVFRLMREFGRISCSVERAIAAGHATIECTATLICLRQ